MLPTISFADEWVIPLANCSRIDSGQYFRGESQILIESSKVVDRHYGSHYGWKVPHMHLFRRDVVGKGHVRRCEIDPTRRQFLNASLRSNRIIRDRHARRFTPFEVEWREQRRPCRAHG